MKRVIRTYNGFTPVDAKLGQIVDSSIHAAFNSKIEIPLQKVLGEANAISNRHGMVFNMLAKHKGFKTDAHLAENQHHKMVEVLFGNVLDYLQGYGSIILRKTKKNGKWAEHWIFILDAKIFSIIEKTQVFIPLASPKKLRKMKPQTTLSDKLGNHTAIEGIDKDYLEMLSKQYVIYRPTKTWDEIYRNLVDLYSESVVLMNGSIRYKRKRDTETKAKAHLKALQELSGRKLPINEKLEPRGRTALHRGSAYGFNLYGKTWETQCFHLGAETIAFDARQSGYQIVSALLSIKPLLKMTGVYGKYKAGDVYTEAFAQVLMRTFNVNASVAREIAKKPAQMLIYMAGMKAILMEDDNGGGSILHHLGNPDVAIDDYVARLEQELWSQPELEPIMELRQAVHDGNFDTYAVPSWRFPDSSEYFFTRTSTNHIYFYDGKMHSDTAKMVVTDDENKPHTMSIHIGIIRELAKGSAILAAIVHSIDGWIKKQVSLDVLAAGGKILVKHDEYIVTKGYEAIMTESYHKWLAYVSAHPKQFLEEPLRSCGYAINVMDLRKKNTERFGKVMHKYIRDARNGLKYEWTTKW